MKSKFKFLHVYVLNISEWSDNIDVPVGAYVRVWIDILEAVPFENLYRSEINVLV